MANPEHLAILKKGVEEWNLWRKKNPNIWPDLGNADLSRTRLQNYIFREANLKYASFKEADLLGANFYFADLYSVDFSNSILRYTSFDSADLSNAKLTDSNMENVDLSYSNLTESDFSNAFLHRAIFIQSYMLRTNFYQAKLRQTIFGSAQFIDTVNLETCIHHGPSTVDIRTLQKSSPLPLKFLRGVGFPDNFIEYLPSLLAPGAIQYYTGFISYCRKDEEFVQRLYADLQNNGVRCWLDTQDLPWGAETRQGIFDAIRVRDKVLLVLSETSIKSHWVKHEVEAAIAKEEKDPEHKKTLIPFCIDKSFEQTNVAWASLLRHERNIGNFTGWKDHDKYKKAFEDLLKWLKYKED